MQKRPISQKNFLIILLLVVLVVTLAFYYIQKETSTIFYVSPETLTDEGSGLDAENLHSEPHPLSIDALKRGEYPGSQITIEQTLAPGSNYDRYVASYISEKLKIFALLTVPRGEAPEGGWPAIIFNHGYISPSVYRTTEKYVVYQDAFAREGYVTFKSDYRGHGSSEGEAQGGYGVNDYTIDVLNAVSSIKNYEAVNPNKIGMWGHSMGGHITLESMVVNKDVKAGVIWAGVVGSYKDIFDRWRQRNLNLSTPTPGGRGSWRYELAKQYGEPEDNPEFWESLSATSYLKDISGPIQLHHGTADSSVDAELTTGLNQALKNINKDVEMFIYEGDDHNLSRNLRTALNRSVAFFDNHLK